MVGQNLKYLRKKKRCSQQSLSDDLGIPRTTLGDYEREKTEPNIGMLLKMAKYFDVSMESFLSKDLSLNDYEVLNTNTLRVLAITVDQDNEGNIELVDTKAEAGYLDSYQNPEFIKELPKIQFPNIPHGTYRGFEIHGDSMLPIESGSIIICSYVESLHELKSNKKKSSKRRGRRIKPTLAVFESEGFGQRLLRFVKELFSCINISQTYARVWFGLHDPADTGRLYGILSPLIVSCFVFPKVDLKISPQFDEPMFETRFHTRVDLVPIKLLWVVLRFVVSKESLRAINAARKAYYA